MDNHYSRFTTGPDPRKTYIKSGINFAPGAVGCWLMVAVGLYALANYLLP